MQNEMDRSRCSLEGKTELTALGNVNVLEALFAKVMAIMWDETFHGMMVHLVAIATKSRHGHAMKGLALYLDQIILPKAIF